jgi:DNA-binding IclR family transcriptional regulator
MAGEEGELETRIMELFHQKNKMLASRDVAKALGLPHSEVKQALTKLINVGTLEFVSFGGATFIQLPK